MVSIHQFGAERQYPSGVQEVQFTPVIALNLASMPIDS